MNGKQKNYWWIDAVLFAGFLVAFFLSLTGVELHQWIGILGGILAFYHLIIHWDWITVVNRRFFDGVARVVKAKFIVDSLLLIGFFLILGTGLVISTWLDLGISNYAGWLRVHILVSILSLCVLLVKLGLHWKWIARSTYSAFFQPRNMVDRRARPQPIPVKAEGMDRRNFMRVMGVVGGASVVALFSATKSLAVLQGIDASINPTTEANDVSSSSSSITGSSQSAKDYSSGISACNLQCGKRCAYPGSCRRYTDGDHDNYCDWGECS